MGEVLPITRFEKNVEKRIIREGDLIRIVFKDGNEMAGFFRDIAKRKFTKYARLDQSFYTSENIFHISLPPYCERNDSPESYEILKKNENGNCKKKPYSNSNSIDRNSIGCVDEYIPDQYIHDEYL